VRIDPNVEARKVVDSHRPADGGFSGLRSERGVAANAEQVAGRTPASARNHVSSIAYHVDTRRQCWHKLGREDDGLRPNVRAQCLRNGIDLILQILITGSPV